MGIQDNPNYQNDIKAFCQTGSANCRTTGRQKDPSDGFPKSTYDYAMFYISNNLSVIPIRPRDKKPLVEWKQYQQQPPSISEIQKWFKNTDNNIAIVTGKVSDNLVVIDFDEESLYKEFLEKLSDDLKGIINDTWTVKTSRGYHVYLRIDSEKPIGAEKYDGVDIKAEHGYVLTPPSIHPSGIRYEFLTPDMPWSKVIRKVSLEEFSKIKTTILEVLKNRGKYKPLKPENGANATETPKPGDGTNGVNGTEAPEAKTEGDGVTNTDNDNSEGREWRDLSNTQILKIVELLKPYYRKGLRHNIVLYLAGWLYKAGIKHESAQTLIKSLCEATGDEECNDRLYTVRDTYGVGRPLREEVLKQEGKSLATKGGLFTWLTEKGGFDEDSVLALIKDLEDVLNRPNPNTDVIVELMNDRKGRFVVVNYRKCEVYTAIAVEDEGGRRLERDDRVIIGCPESLTVITPPYSRIPKYDIVWNIPSQKRKLSLEGVTVTEILEFLEANALTLHRNAKEVLNAVINAMVRKGLAIIKTGYESPGFYWVDGKLITSKVEVRKPSQEELREALELLNELAMKWFTKVQAQFITALKVGILMPFSFAIKQKFTIQKGFLPWLYLYGEKNTGKSTTGEVILYIFGVNDNNHKLGLGDVNTEAKLGTKLAEDTFPKVVDESESLFDIPNLVEIIKHSVEGLVARRRFETKSTIREYPALAPLILTANHLRITDPALTQKRLIILRYPISASLTPEGIAEFKEKVSGRLAKLRALGQFVEWYLMEHPEELTYDWVNLSVKLLQKAYEYAGVKPAFNLRTLYIDVEEYDPRLDIVLSLWSRLQEAFMKKIDERDESGRKVVPREPFDVLKKVLENHAVDFMIKYGEDEVFITSKILQVLQSEKIIVDSMHAIAELFADYGFRYEVRKIGGKATRVLTVRFDNLVRLFSEYLNPQEPREQPLI